ncbi:MAG TPA: UDP-glucose 4-epimerase GalE [Candidatus Saccharimonadales bacterium]|nr:UDP-glucose 4-epimerase GalE [Candidatus Saccharimonadales bacterium]
MKNILVTGGAGFIGSHTVVELVSAGYRPVIVDNFSNSDKSVLSGLKKITGKQIACYETDFQDKGIQKILIKEKIDGVIHFAAFKAVGESVEQPLKYYNNNLSGMLDLLSNLLKQKINNFVFSSSAAVYGNPPTDIVTEDTTCAPTSPYGWSKYMDEIVLRDLCASNPTLRGVALRYFNVIGAHPSAKIGERPKGKPQNLLPIILQASTEQVFSLTVYGTDYPTPDGTCLRDYIHVVDLAKAHVAALQKLEKKDSAENYSVYNLGTGKPTSVLELLKTFEKVNGVKVPYKIGPRRPGDPAAYFASPKKANKGLGWKTQRSVQDAVADAWRWQQTIERKSNG